MLSEVGLKFFPSYNQTSFDNGTLAARVTSIQLDDMELASFRSDLDETRLDAAVLFDWYQWFRKQDSPDPGGMFKAIRQQHQLTRSLAEGPRQSSMLY